jgi:hypothetical protein
MKLQVKYFLTTILAVAFLAAAAVVAGQSTAHADPIPPGWMAKNMHPIGYSDLGGWGGAFKEAIKQVNGHWYLFLGNLWHRGWTIVDVTDPANPKVVKHVPGPPNTWTIQMEFHGNLMVLSLAKFSPLWGADPNKPNQEGLDLFDISDPTNWKLLDHWEAGPESQGTHRNGYDP